MQSAPRSATSAERRTSQHRPRPQRLDLVERALALDEGQQRPPQAVDRAVADGGAQLGLDGRGLLGRALAHAAALGAEAQARAAAVVGVRGAQQVAALDHLVGQLARRLAADAEQLGQAGHRGLLGVDGADDEAEGRPRIARARLADRRDEAVVQAAGGCHEDDGQVGIVNHDRLSTIVA